MRSALTASAIASSSETRATMLLAESGRDPRRALISVARRIRLCTVSAANAATLGSPSPRNGATALIPCAMRASARSLSASRIAASAPARSASAFATRAATSRNCARARIQLAAASRSSATCTRHFKVALCRAAFSTIWRLVESAFSSWRSSAASFVLFSKCIGSRFRFRVRGVATGRTIAVRSLPPVLRRRDSGARGASRNVGRARRRLEVIEVTGRVDVLSFVHGSREEQRSCRAKVRGIARKRLPRVAGGTARWPAGRPATPARGRGVADQRRSGPESATQLCRDRDREVLNSVRRRRARERHFPQ